MSTFPNSPRLLKGGIILMDPNTSKVIRIVALQSSNLKRIQSNNKKDHHNIGCLL